MSDIIDFDFFRSGISDLARNMIHGILSYFQFLDQHLQGAYTNLDWMSNLEITENTDEE